MKFAINRLLNSNFVNDDLNLKDNDDLILQL